ncbi:MAG: FAD-dependent oxidoreductase [Proteobacteria bacterium]|nr:FAD-dependent oxidoreductase [Pseudomonadota bacterium]
MSSFPNLFSEIALGRTVVKNRIVSTGHHTHHAHGAPSDRLVAYQEARARGGAGLIVMEVAAVHESAQFSANLLQVTAPDCIPGYAKVVDACRPHGARVFGQLFHPGREIQSTADGMMAVAYAPSAVPNERFHIMPRPMPEAMIEEVIAGFGRGAGYLAEAGLDGVEIVASHSYLPAQFINPRLNQRTDRWGGSFENRLRFLKEAIAVVRKAIGDRTLGMRISGDEVDPAQGLDADEVAAICSALAPDLDYLSVVAGMSSTLGSSIHVVPPMGIPAGYIAPYARRVREATGLPVIATGRINQPQIAEAMLAAGDADLCGMTRAMICDPAMPQKAAQGRLDDIRACIGCNQACIGHSHKGVPISCIQYPESGREEQYGSLVPTTRPRRVLVAGGGPAGLKAAAVAAARGHDVTLMEKAAHLGGQALLAQKLPGREEFGGIVQNLEHEARVAGVTIRTGAVVDAAVVREYAPDAVIVATGARPYAPMLEGRDEAHMVEAWDVLSGRANVGASVVIADWRCDWIGIGLAEMLAVAGSRVTLCLNGAMAGETLQLYVRNHYLGRLHKLGVPVRTHLRLFGADADSAYFQDTLTGDAVVIEEIDTVVTALGHIGDDDLLQALAGFDGELRAIGDCIVSRSAEEAVYEGLVAGWEI